MAFEPRRFMFYGTPRNTAWQADIEFVESERARACSFCGSAEDLLTLFVRLVVTPASNGRRAPSPCPATGRVVFEALPHGKSFCPHDRDRIALEIERGLRKISIARG